MRIEWVMEMPQEKQLNYFNTVVVTGELFGRGSCVFFVFGIGVLLGNNGYSFYAIRNVFFLVLWFWDLVSLACCFSIPVSYFLPEGRSVDSLQSTSSVQLDDDVFIGDDSEGRNIDSSSDFSKKSSSYPQNETTSQNLSHLVSKEELQAAYEPEIELGEDPSMMARGEKTKNPLVALKDYFVGSARRFWDNGPLVFSAVHLWMVFMLVSFVNIVLKFHVSDVGTGLQPNRTNLCAGQMINLLRVSLSEHAATLVGVFVYNFVFVKVKPFFFFNKLFVGMAALFNFLFISIFWKQSMGATGSSIVLGALYVGLYLVQTYDGNVSAAWSDPTIIAFVFAMQASFAQVLALVPIGFAALKVPDTFVIIFCGTVSSLLAFASLWYSRSNKQKILLLSEPDTVNHDELSNYLPLSTIHDQNQNAFANDDDMDYPSAQFHSPEDLDD